MKILAPLALLLALAAPAVEAATLTGDTVDLTYTSSSSGVFGPISALVGVGEDGNFFSNQFFDLDAGAGYVFTIRSNSVFCGIASCSTSDTITLTLSDLDFGVPLTSVAFLTNLVGASVSALSATSVAFTWNETALLEGEYLSVRFNVSAVPVPAALPLMLLALGGLGVAARRRRT